MTISKTPDFSNMTEGEVAVSIGIHSESNTVGIVHFNHEGKVVAGFELCPANTQDLDTVIKGLQEVRKALEAKELDEALGNTKH